MEQQTKDNLKGVAGIAVIVVAFYKAKQASRAGQDIMAITLGALGIALGGVLIMDGFKLKLK